MGSFDAALGSVVVSHQYGNMHAQNGSDHSMMILSNKLFAFIHHLI